ncbi:50S ribosomal protein L2 [Frankliniella fusca]|uniref:50S ribosomal protein L2 n=1 Tax=Frankliniella fusca TaxID=407009 RepID=A0AAE1GUR0_9NEOP|nr:50S ribosomal protein L2 [Frankliniella fusca]
MSEAENGQENRINNDDLRKEGIDNLVKLREMYFDKVYSIELSREETLKSVQRADSLFWHALSPTQKGVIKGLMERLYAPSEDKNLFKDLIKHCIE